MKIDWHIPEQHELDLSNASVGDLVVTLREEVHLSSEMKQALEKETGGLVAPTIVVQVAKPVALAALAKLCKEQRLISVVGEVVE